MIATVSGIQNLTIGGSGKDGVFTILDANDVPQVQIGKLGSYYGINVVGGMPYATAYDPGQQTETNGLADYYLTTANSEFTNCPEQTVGDPLTVSFTLNNSAIVWLSMDLQLRGVYISSTVYVSAVLRLNEDSIASASTIVNSEVVEISVQRSRTVELDAGTHSLSLYIDSNTGVSAVAIEPTLIAQSLTYTSPFVA